MKALLVLLSSFALSLIGYYLKRKVWNVKKATQMGMGAMLAFTGIGHFAFAQGMVGMLPSFVIGPYAWVYGTGVLELGFSAGLFAGYRLQRIGWALVAFLILVLPANIYAAWHHINYQTGGSDGPGPEYLWFRVPLQMLFIAWVYWACKLNTTPRGKLRLLGRVDLLRKSN